MRGGVDRGTGHEAGVVDPELAGPVAMGFLRRLRGETGRRRARGARRDGERARHRDRCGRWKECETTDPWKFSGVNVRYTVYTQHCSATRTSSRTGRLVSSKRIGPEGPEREREAKRLRLKSGTRVFFGVLTCLRNTGRRFRWKIWIRSIPFGQIQRPGLWIGQKPPLPRRHVWTTTHLGSPRRKRGRLLESS